MKHVVVLLLAHGNAACSFLVPQSVLAHAQTEKSERNQSKSSHVLGNLITELKSSSLYGISLSNF